MTDEITHREWGLIVGKIDETARAVKELSSTVSQLNNRLAERGAQHDARFEYVERTAAEAYRTAQMAQAAADKAHSRVDVHEERLKGNTQTLDGWTGLVLKIAGGLILAAILFTAGRII